MTDSLKPDQAQDHRAADSQDFLPNLCRVQSLGLLLLFSELLVLVVMLMKYSALSFNWLAFSQTSFFVLWITWPISALLCVFRKKLNQLAPNQSILIIILGVQVWVAIVTLLASTMLPNLTPPQTSWLATNCLIALLISTLVLYVFYLQWVSKKRKAIAMTSQLMAMQARMKPHFLFNVMNTLAAMVHIDANKSEQMIENLAALLRASIGKQGVLVSLDEELTLCRQYIEIEKVRLGDKLQVEFEVEDNLSAMQLPQFTLQPLIENAVLHGIQKRIEGGCIRVELKEQDKFWRMTVTNPKGITGASDSNQGASQGNRMALRNIEQRLLSVFDGKAKVNIADGEDEFKVELMVPKLSQNELP